jgi:hypothetical protein
MGLLGKTRFPPNMPPLRIWSMEKLWVPKAENSWRTLALSDSVAVTMAMRAMIPMPMMPTVSEVRRTCPRMERNATCTMSRHNVDVEAMGLKLIHDEAVAVQYDKR